MLALGLSLDQSVNFLESKLMFANFIGRVIAQRLSTALLGVQPFCLGGQTWDLGPTLIWNLRPLQSLSFGAFQTLKETSISLSKCRSNFLLIFLPFFLICNQPCQGFLVSVTFLHIPPSQNLQCRQKSSHSPDGLSLPTQEWKPHNSFKH